MHSNDARGSTISVDPIEVSPIELVDPLAGSVGNEVGVIYDWNDKLNTSVPLWGLDLGSRLLYVGDVGNTETSRPSASLT